MNKPRKKFAENFAKAKEKASVSHADIYRATGISYPNLWHYSNGNSVPRVSELVALAKVLKCKIEDLLEGV